MPKANEVLPETLMNSVLGKLYDLLTNGDETVPKSEDNFLSWSTPGIPFSEEDFEFLTYGLTGVVKPGSQPPPSGNTSTTEGGKTTTTENSSTTVNPSTTVENNVNPTVTPPQTPEELRAQHTAQLYMQAENLARFVNVIPDASGINEQLIRMNVKNDEGSLSDIYDHVLRYSQVAKTELSEEDKQKIEKFRQLLQVEREKEDILTNEKTKVLEPSPLTKIYYEKQQAWIEAALEYNNVRINALTASTPQAVHNWALNGSILRKKVNGALSDWINNGYKNEFEKIAAFIDQVSSRDLTLLKAQYKDDLERAKLTGLASGSDFFYTSLVPGNFYKSKGWTHFSFTESDYDYYSKTDSTSWGASGGVSVGLFTLGGSGGSSKTTSNSKLDRSNFRLEFDMCQVPIARPWFKLNFLTSKSWRFDPGNVVADGDFLSDGKLPPARESLLPAFPTSIIFIRNLYLQFSSSSNVQSFVDESTNAGGVVGYGPFFVGGSYKDGSTERKQDYHSEGQGIRVPGMQAIGFKCHLLPKSPNPNPNIKDWV
jgi:hypothetical protein